MNPYNVPRPPARPPTPEQVADSTEWRERIESALRLAAELGTTSVVMEAPGHLIEGQLATFWAAVRLRLEGTGWTVAPANYRDSRRIRAIVACDPAVEHPTLRGLEEITPPGRRRNMLAIVRRRLGDVGLTGLAGMSRGGLLRTPEIGPVMVGEVESLLAEHGLTIQEDT